MGNELIVDVSLLFVHFLLGLFSNAAFQAVDEVLVAPRIYGFHEMLGHFPLVSCECLYPFLRKGTILLDRRGNHVQKFVVFFLTEPLEVLQFNGGQDVLFEQPVNDQFLECNILLEDELDNLEVGDKGFYFLCALPHPC